MEITQYAVVLVNLDPTGEKTRTCVVISPNEMNKYLRTVVVAPMTTNENSYPTRVPMKHNGKNGMIAIDQIRTIDKKRVIKRFNDLSEKEIQACKEVIKETYVD